MMDKLIANYAMGPTISYNLIGTNVTGWHNCTNIALAPNSKEEEAKYYFLTQNTGKWQRELQTFLS